MTCAADADDLDAIELRDMARLNLNPGDTLVVTLDAPTSAHVVDRVRHRILADLGDRIDEKHLLVVSGVELSVLPADETPHQQHRAGEAPIVALTLEQGCFPLIVSGTVAGRPVWYRARGGRWELYEGRESDLSGVDAEDRLTGKGITWLAGGVPEDDQSVDEALDHIRDECAAWLPEGADTDKHWSVGQRQSARRAHHDARGQRPEVRPALACGDPVSGWYAFGWGAWLATVLWITVVVLAARSRGRA